MRAASSFASASATVLFMILASALLAPAQDADLKELRFTVNEVTETDISAIPNNGGIVFTLLGDLYRLPVTGGNAVQITTGPYFHKEPSISPDGKWIAVVSNRDPRKGDNIYLLEISGGNVRRISNEPEAGRPSWSPDGKRLAFLSYKGQQPVADFNMFPRQPAMIKEIDLATGEITVVTNEYEEIRDVTYGPEGELYWISIQPGEGCNGCKKSLIRKRSVDGEESIDATLDGIADQLRISKLGFFYSFIRRNTNLSVIAYEKTLEGRGRPVSRGDMPQGGSTSRRFAINDQSTVLYTYNWGSLWVIDKDGLKSRLPFRADVRRTIYSPAPPPKYVPPEDSGTFEAGIIGDPVLRPDGRELAFAAAGSVWLLSLEDPNAKPERLTTGVAMDPAYSADGKMIAFVRRVGFNNSEIVVTEGPRGTQKVLAKGAVSRPSWAPDGDRIVYREGWGLRLVTVSDGRSTDLQKPSVWYVPRFSADGSSIIAQRRNRPVDDRVLVRFSLDDPKKETLLTDIREHMNDALISPSGKWMAFGRNGDLWVANLAEALKDDDKVSEDEVELFEREAGLAFSFDPRPGSQALIYGKDRRIFRAELPNGKRIRIAGPFTLPPAEQASIVIRNIRVLSKEGTRYSEQTTIFVNGGRITGIGSPPKGFDLNNAVIVEGEGRYAVPGLWDSHLHGGISGDGAPWLRMGVTSHRDMGSEIVDAVQEVDHDRAYGPTGLRRFYSGEIFEGYNDNWWGLWNRVTDPETARSLPVHWKKLGVRFIKVYRTLPWPLVFEVATAARDNGIPLVGHGIFPDQIIRSITLGFGSLEHLGLERLPRDDLLKLMAAAGTYPCPTIAVNTNLEGILMLRDPEKRGKLLMETGNPAQQNVKLWMPNSPGELLGFWGAYSRQLRRADELGLKLLMGTDGAGGPGGLNSELEAFQDAGFAPHKVLRMATLYPAMAEGVENDLGTLEVGKLADLILLDKDPLEDVANLRKPSFVIRGGMVIHSPDE